jgi:hypothetical protein
MAAWQETAQLPVQLVVASWWVQQQQERRASWRMALGVASSSKVQDCRCVGVRKGGLS